MWHKGSWEERFRRDEMHREQRGAPAYSVDPVAGTQAPAGAPAAYAHRHTHTHTFTTGRSHTHRTTLLRGAAPPVTPNANAFFGEIGAQVALVNRTLEAVKARCEAHKLGELGGGGDAATSVGLRRELGESVAAQMEYYMACMQVWTGLTAAQHAQFCGAMMDAMRSWHTWSATEQRTFLELFTRAAAESKAQA